MTATAADIMTRNVIAAGLNATAHDRAPSGKSRHQCRTAYQCARDVAWHVRRERSDEALARQIGGAPGMAGGVATRHRNGICRGT